MRRVRRAGYKLSMPVMLGAAALLLVLADQILQGRPLWGELWLDIPLAALLAGLALRWRRPPTAPSEIEAIDTVVSVVGRGRHVDEVLSSLTREACNIMGIERSVVLLRDETDPRSVIVAAGHGVPADMVGERFGIDEGMSGEVMRTGEPLLVDEYGSLARPIRHPATLGLRAGGAAPVRRGKVVVGALTAGTTDAARRFGAAELETLCRLAGLGGLALEQAYVREELEQAVDGGVQAMAAAIDMRDDYTGQHSEEVVRLAMRVGERLGLGPRALSELEIAARLHDVGKIGVPDSVLRKDGPLDRGEWEIMRRHPEWGARLLGRVPGLRRVARIVRHAHERWDGDGYPDRLHTRDIPIESRIIFACDAFEAMTSDRPYRDAMRPWIAVSELREGAGNQFDPDVVDVLVDELRAERAVSTRLFPQARVSIGV
jgi:GAF domain-containing protein